jgi:hypothetical protein
MDFIDMEVHVLVEKIGNSSGSLKEVLFRGR